MYQIYGCEEQERDGPRTANATTPTLRCKTSWHRFWAALGSEPMGSVRRRAGEYVVYDAWSQLQTLPFQAVLGGFLRIQEPLWWEARLPPHTERKNSSLVRVATEVREDWEPNEDIDPARFLLFSFLWKEAMVRMYRNWIRLRSHIFPKCAVWTRNYTWTPGVMANNVWFRQATTRICVCRP